MNQPFIQDFSVHHLIAPLNQPFRTALGDHDRLENVLFRLKLTTGEVGFGEAAVAEHITGEKLKVTFENLKKFGAGLVGRPITDYRLISGEAQEQFPKNRSAVAAVESAMVDSFTRWKKIPLWKLFGRRSRKLRTDITVVIADLKETERTAKKFYQQGFRIFKVKIGRDIDLDLKRVAIVNKVAKYGIIYLDANQGFNAREILGFVGSLKKMGVQPRLLEQPVRKDDWEGLRTVSRLAGIPVCADESVASAEDARKLIKGKRAQAINIKLVKSGMFEAMRIVKLARAAGIKLMIGGMMETSIAMTASAHFAAGLGGFDFIDLDTPFFIKKGYDRNPFLSSSGTYDLYKVENGIGIVPMKKTFEIYDQ